MTCEFKTPLDTRLITDDDAGSFQLLTDFVYLSDIGGLITAPAGFVTDFASVPRIPIIYDIYGNTARKPSTIHDWLYSQRMWGDREKCDRILREAMEAEGLHHDHAEAFYLAVREGGQAYWDGTVSEVSVWKPNTDYLWRPDTPDVRDHLFMSPPVPPVLLPGAVDLSPHCLPAFDQGQIGSCTANALAGAVGFLHGAEVSRLFIYYNERNIEGTVSTDSGAMLRDGIKSLVKYGVCPEAEWPYTPEMYRLQPARLAYADALDCRIADYQRLTVFNDMIACLAGGHPFVFGFTVYESFESDEVARTGILNLPEHGEAMIGGHAVMAVGYDMHTKRFLVRNSWGDQWGLAGNFTIPFEYLTNRQLSDDFWRITK